MAYQRRLIEFPNRAISALKSGELEVFIMIRPKGLRKRRFFTAIQFQKRLTILAIILLRV